MTMQDYQLRIGNIRFEQLDKERDLYLQAYLNNRATATKKKGKDIVSAYPEFKDFFDYEKRLEEMTEPKEKEERKLSRLESLVLQANS